MSRHYCTANPCPLCHPVYAQSAKDARIAELEAENADLRRRLDALVEEVNRAASEMESETYGWSKVHLGETASKLKSAIAAAMGGE
jgi:hypothetical protein